MQINLGLAILASFQSQCPIDQADAEKGGALKNHAKITSNPDHARDRKKDQKRANEKAGDPVNLSDIRVQSFCWWDRFQGGAKS